MKWEQRFKTLTNRNGLKPFWFWNGEIEESQIDRQMDEMLEKGIRGFVLCPRQGLKVPYMSGRWIQLVEYACKKAYRRGMELWLYDEYPYPSGMCGGQVLLDVPDGEHKKLVCHSAIQNGGEPFRMNLGWSQILYAGAHKIRDDKSVDYGQELSLTEDIGILQTRELSQKSQSPDTHSRRYFSYGPQHVLCTVLPKGRWQITVFGQESLKDYKYFGNYMDPCCEEAVDAFLRQTHEKYARHLSQYFGSCVKGFFADEVFYLGKLPWSKRLPGYFKERWGYDLCKVLPALCDSAYPDAALHRYRYFQSADELLKKCYHGKISAWCDAHGLSYVTEVPSLRRTTQEYSHVPGGDPCHEKLGESLEAVYDKYLADYRKCAPGIASLAAQLNKKQAMLECFHSVGWSMTLQDAKWMTDWMAAMGIGCLVPHAFYYTADGLTKHDAPPSQFFQNPYWKYYKLFADYAARLNVWNEAGERVSQIALLDPVASLWTKLGSPREGFRYGGTEKKEEEELTCLREDWIFLAKQLFFAQLPFDFLDAQLLERAEIKEGELVMGRAGYRMILVPPVTYIEPGMASQLKEFIAQGGYVAGSGRMPEDQDYAGLFSDDGHERTSFFAWNSPKERMDVWKRLSAWIQKRLTMPLQVSAEDETSPCELITSLRKGEAGFWYLMMVNHGNRQLNSVIWAKQEMSCLEQWMPETGECSPIEMPSENVQQIRVCLRGYESKFLRIKLADTKTERRDHKETADIWERETEEIEILIDENDRIIPLGDNVFRISDFEISTDGKEWKQAEVGPVMELVRNAKLEGSLDFSYKNSFGTPTTIEFSYPFRIWYRASVQLKDEIGRLKLMMNNHGIKGSYQIAVNGHVIQESDWRKDDTWNMNNQSADVAEYFHKGSNLLEISVWIGQEEDGMTDPLYLLGSFEVHGKKIGDVKEGGKNAYPWYSGSYRVRKEFEADGQTEGEEIIFELGQKGTFVDCMEVCLNGRSLGVRVFAPYRFLCPSKWLKEHNVLDLTITNTLAPALEGGEYDMNRRKLIL